MIFFISFLANSFHYQLYQSLTKTFCFRYFSVDPVRRIGWASRTTCTRRAAPTESGGTTSAEISTSAVAFKKSAAGIHKIIIVYVKITQGWITCKLDLALYFFQSYQPKLLSLLEVAGLEDVYWVGDSEARRIFSSDDFKRWSEARQKLPASKPLLDQLKADLWSEVVKGSNHQDAWTWGRYF